MTYEEFLKDATTKQMYDYMQFCFKNNYIIGNESVERFITYSNWDHKVTLVAKSLCKHNRITEIYHLIKWLTVLIGDLESYRDSEGIGKPSDTELQAVRWIEENINIEENN